MAQQRREDQKTANKLMAGTFRFIPKWLLWSVGILLGLLLLLFIMSFFLDEPLRKSMESNMNSHLKGYSVRLPGLHSQLIGLSVTLKGLTVSQQEHPEHPVAEFPHLKQVFIGDRFYSVNLLPNSNSTVLHHLARTATRPGGRNLRKF